MRGSCSREESEGGIRRGKKVENSSGRESNEIW